MTLHQTLISFLWDILEYVDHIPRLGIPMDTNCAPLHADLFLFSYKADFMQEFLKKRKEASRIL
jgi:hypothetical protein